ncbi:MAG: (NiFe) hydrogenase maturation protein HypF [Bacillales bacterium]|jgi:hydrogenase maturation protein HypF|nr:(NiFe) hydrogenase maturation protein HypF [Bacillales bacterium]
MSKAIKVTVKGRVQGVGFRPFIFSLADQYRLKGTVQNNMDGVKIHVESDSFQNLESFVSDIRLKSPRLSKITEIKSFEASYEAFDDFTIIPSESKGSSSLVIPIDAAVCDECLEEMRDPSNFRYNYPFINCTQCGPRYTIISSLPYDRPVTSMKNFPMCDDCAKEYNDPLNRRHHAQPIACPKCGPQLKLYEITGNEIQVNDIVHETRKLLLEGKIVAIKGIGGYHLCCDATNEETVRLLRLRKNRPDRPLAIMAISKQFAQKIANISQFEESILTSPEAPIVLLKKNSIETIANSVAPGTSKIGIMLPYTPMHHLLLDEKTLPFIIATSANPSGLPILYRDSEAFEYVKDIADCVLMHNREILHPIDDSVVECNGEELTIIRRSRGFSPDPLNASQDVNGIVAFGGQMKNTFAIGRGEQIIIGPHIGEMDHIEMEDHFKNELYHLMQWTTVPNQTAVIDKHPLYATRNIAKSYSFNEVIEIQHHHAHMAGCMEENNISENCYGIILDGTGFGLDGNIWGYEIFYGNKREFNRIGHLNYTPLPGGDKAVREPWRNAVGMLIHLYGQVGYKMANQQFPGKENLISVMNEMVQKGINSPLAGSCGRLYDAVSAILGICEISTYDGQAAILLSEVAEETNETYSIHWIDDTLHFGKMITEIIRDKNEGVPISKIAGKFQKTIVESFIKKLYALQPGKVVLSGGSFHNMYLLSELTKELTRFGYDVYHHINVPTGDGGLSYGQLVAAAAIRV